MAAPPHAYRNPRLSPDGQRVAVTIDELGTQEWLLDTVGGTLTRLTFEGSYNGALHGRPTERESHLDRTERGRGTCSGNWQTAAAARSV